MNQAQVEPENLSRVHVPPIMPQLDSHVYFNVNLFFQTSVDKSVENKRQNAAYTV